MFFTQRRPRGTVVARPNRVHRALLDDTPPRPNFAQTPLDADDLGLESGQPTAKALQRRLHVSLMSVLRISDPGLRLVRLIEAPKLRRRRIKLEYRPRAHRGGKKSRLTMSAPSALALSTRCTLSILPSSQ